jgi:hypothetical protein
MNITRELNKGTATSLDMWVALLVSSVLMVLSLYKVLSSPKQPEIEPSHNLDQGEFFHKPKPRHDSFISLPKSIVQNILHPWRFIPSKTHKPAPKLTHLTDDYALSSDGELIEIDDEDSLPDVETSG